MGAAGPAKPAERLFEVGGAAGRPRDLGRTAGRRGQARLIVPAGFAFGIPVELVELRD